METQDSYQETRYHIINSKQQEQPFHKNEKNRCINRMEDQKLKFGKENIPLSIFPLAAPYRKNNILITLPFAFTCQISVFDFYIEYDRSDGIFQISLEKSNWAFLLDWSVFLEFYFLLIHAVWCV